MGTLDDAPLVQCDSRAEWRAWLAERGTARAAWLVTWKRATGRETISYDDAVLEALAVGWVDGVKRSLDDERSMQYFAARKPGSAWAATNKARVAQLESAGLMTAAGAAVIDAAKADGSWALFDDVEKLVVPQDLADAFDRIPGSREAWDGFPKSTRRGILAWIVVAKRRETRARRIAETAESAGRGERAHQQSTD